MSLPRGAKGIIKGCVYTAEGRAAIEALVQQAYSAGRKDKWKEYMRGGCSWALNDEEFT